MSRTSRRSPAPLRAVRRVPPGRRRRSPEATGSRSPPHTEAVLVSPAAPVRPRPGRSCRRRRCPPRARATIVRRALGSARSNPPVRRRARPRRSRTRRRPPRSRPSRSRNMSSPRLLRPQRERPRAQRSWACRTGRRRNRPARCRRPRPARRRSRRQTRRSARGEVREASRRPGGASGRPARRACPLPAPSGPSRGQRYAARRHPAAGVSFRSSAVVLVGVSRVFARSMRSATF